QRPRLAIDGGQADRLGGFDGRVDEVEDRQGDCGRVEVPPDVRQLPAVGEVQGVGAFRQDVAVVDGVLLVQVGQEHDLDVAGEQGGGPRPLGRLLVLGDGGDRQSTSARFVLRCLVGQLHVRPREGVAGLAGEPAPAGATAPDDGGTITGTGAGWAFLPATSWMPPGWDARRRKADNSSPDRLSNAPDAGFTRITLPVASAGSFRASGRS